MTTKKSITNEFEKIKDGVLSSLSAKERASLVVQVAAACDYDSLEELVDTAPKSAYKGTDPEFGERMAALETLAVYALWELDRGSLRFDIELMRGKYQNQLYQQYPDAEWTEAPGEENGYHEGEAYEAAARFLVTYRAWSRFVEEELNVPLKDFLTFPFTDGVDPVVARIEATVAMADGSNLDDELAEFSWAANASIDVDAAVDRKYAQLEV